MWQWCPWRPLAELHASAVQHPEHAHMRWLLNTRRVPVLTGSATEHPAGNAASTVAYGSLKSLTYYSDADPRPPCAGIGDAEKAVWLCKECAAHLCRPEPNMPPKARANWNWGGREHPLYQHLTTSMRTLLGMGRLVMRMVLLKPRDNTDESERAIVGNTI